MEDGNWKMEKTESGRDEARAKDAKHAKRERENGKWKMSDEDDGGGAGRGLHPAEA